MLVTDLFEKDINPWLITWLQQHSTALEVLKALKGMFADLRTDIQGEVQDNVSITGQVVIGKGSVIHGNVSIEGPVIIGENVRVSSHAQIRQHAYIGNDCVVGHGADIKHALCIDGAKIQDGTFAGDSVLGQGVRIGSGAILANRKFNQTEIAIKTLDGTNTATGLEFMGALLGAFVRVGANAVLSPGTVVYPHTWIGSGVVLHGTHAGDQLITVKQELDIKPKDRISLRSGKGEYEYM